MESNASVSCLEAFANTTTVERHASLVASLASVGAPSAAANLLVLNIIDRALGILLRNASASPTPPFFGILRGMRILWQLRHVQNRNI